MTDDLSELERIVELELHDVETSQPVDEAVRVPVDDWIFDPAEAEGDEVRLRSLLGAVETMENPPQPGANHATEEG
ncbi:hypothetical protein Ais01nite_01490 [Asanoa ishikariensis]|uniref:Uncharacterized protein n=1 Tax=Asanoa ishikariensis TaxID=137265 RepID=A0A1H3TPK0_9ACTN|nr:hypothetical protein [Asanoa ishikariensis]GIF62114.1 hypothetical protein Ais01nite_01490 [Asanoa ishikariensis]SDZ51565.1 hypothetical protein SAMN05421684_6073 [Asanoa ishikariensis]